MAIKLTTQYLSENEFLYDVAQSTGKFDTAMYEQQKELGTSEQYAELIARTLTLEPKSAFDNIFYDKLSSEDKLAYITQKYYTDVDSDQYKKNEEYFKQKEQEIKNKEIYEGLSGFEKAAATTAGWVGTALNSVLGIAEGVVDFLGIAAGQLAQLSGIPLITGNTKEVSNAVKEFIAKDTTGYSGVQKALNNYNQAYTFIDKNGLAKGVNDIAANLGQYATVFIPVVGPALFWTSIAGNTAEQNIHSNPDIDWSSLMVSTGLTVGVEGLTEYLGGKLFPDDIISSKLFGTDGTGLASTLIEKVGINFLSEGLEEGVAEFLGSLVYASLVTGDEKDVASFKDILYASLIGGIMGAGATTITTLATTPKYSIVNGELVETSTLSKEEKKLAKNLGFRGSYELINQIDRTQQVLQQPTAVASLMTKYGTSLSDIRKNHTQEYQNAVEEDIAIDEKKTDMVLDLSNLLQTIGIDQFVKSAELLNENVDNAREMVDNYLNHTDVLNKQASAVFSKHFPDQTFTPQQTTSQEQVVTEGLRKVFPQYKFVFGKYGSKNGQPIRQINVNDKNKYVFIESGLVDKLGVEQTISRIIRQHIAQDVMARIDKLPANKTDALVTLITDKAVKYKDLTESQKRTIAQIICFDPIKNKKVFNQSKQVHQDVFNYITKQAGFVRDLGVRNKTNQIRYRDLMKIRETFMNAISRTVYSKADIQAVRNNYNLTEDELKNKIVFKTRPTILNKNAQLMNLDMSEQGNAKHTAMQMLLDSRLDTTVDFDWNRLYDSTYYTTDFVASLMQNEKNIAMFEPLLREYINNQFDTELDLNDRDSLILFVNNNMSPQEIQKSAQIVLTDEFVQANKDSVLNSELGSMLYTLSGKENVVTEQDGIILTDNQIQGTGKLKFLKVKVDERNNISNDQQQGRPSEGAREQVGDVVTKSTTIANKVTIDEIDETSYNDRLREIVRHAKREYGANVHFFSGSAKFQHANININDGLNGFVVGIDDIYLRYDETTPFRDIEDVLLHEGTHILIAKDPNTFKDVRNKLRDKINERVAERNREEWLDWAMERVGPEPVEEQLPWDKLMAEYSSQEMYGDIYDKQSDIEEELVVDLLTFRTVTKERSTNGDIRNIAYEYYATTKDDTGARRKYATKTRDLSDVSFEAHEVWDRTPYQQFNSKYAVWKQSTLDKLIERFGRWDNDSYTSAYVAYINPVNFVANSTQGALERTIIRQGLFEPDSKKRKTDFDDYDYMTKIDETVKEDNVPRFWINTNTMEITGHEGRHRNYTFDINNIENVPVLLIVDEGITGNNPLANRIYKNVTFKGQQQSITEVDSPDAVMFGVMVPLNESHRTELEKMFVKGDAGEPKIKFAKDLKQQLKQETSIQQKINKAESPKQIADVITAIIEAAPLEMSETKGYGDEGTRMYKKTSDEMRRKYASLWTKITQENYDKVRNELVKSDYEYADEALLIFDRFTRAYAGNSTKFDEATKKKIMDVGSRKQTIAAISQGLQSAELANEHSFGETAAAFEKDGYKVTVSNDTVKEYVPEMANKKEFIKELDKEISNIEEQIKTAETDIDAAELNNQLDKAVEKRIVMSEGTNEEIMDWVIKNEDIVTKASKLQTEVFEQMVEKGELAQKEGKKAVTILVDEKTGLPKPFPKATQFIEKNVKRFKSFRMWAMLTSPVSWVRNWVGNAGMTALDGMTNSLEKFITSKQKVMSQQELAKLEKQHQELSRKEKLTDTEKSKLAQLSNQIARNYDFKFVETKASKDLRKQIADDYKDVIQQILNGEDVKYESSAEKAAAITRAERKITRASQNANLGQKLWAACQSMTDWGLNTGWFGDNAVVVNSLVKNFANMVESNKTYLIKSLTTEYGKEGRGMSADRKALVEKALKTKDSMDIVNAMSKYDVTLFMDSCKQRTFEQYFKNSNWLSQWASNLSKKHPIAASLTSLVLPFPKVAANILSMAYKYSPLGFLSAARQWSVVKQMDAAGYEGVRDAFARAKAGRTTAQATVGSFMMLAGLILASLGFIDIDDDDYLGPSLKVGDWKVSLSNLAPSMTTFSVGAAMMWAWKNDQSATLKALDVLYDNTLLGNIENVFRYGDPSKYIENLSINYFSQYVPAVLKLFTKFTTNQEMIDKSGSYFAKLGKTFASGIPGIANLLPKKINPYTGETLTGTGTSNVFFNFIEALSPLDMRFDVKSATQKEAERLATESSGLSGTFKVNDKEYVVDKVTYSKYRANYIQDNFDKILSGKVKVTVEDENGKRITTTYDKLNDKQKKNVINRLYTEATTMTKIKWWTDQGNKYVVTNRDLYKEYNKMFSNIIYKKTWTKSKFVES